MARLTCETKKIMKGNTAAAISANSTFMTNITTSMPPIESRSISMPTVLCEAKPWMVVTSSVMVLKIEPTRWLW